MLKNGYMNIYRSGYFHRENKPGMLNRHAGDIYTDREEAVKQIFPRSHYICTVSVEWEDSEDCVVNPLNSIPVPLNLSRKRFARQMEEMNLSTSVT